MYPTAARIIFWGDTELGSSELRCWLATFLRASPWWRCTTPKTDVDTQNSYTWKEIHSKSTHQFVYLCWISRGVKIHPVHRKPWNWRPTLCFTEMLWIGWSFGMFHLVSVQQKPQGSSSFGPQTRIVSMVNCSMRHLWAKWGSSFSGYTLLVHRVWLALDMVAVRTHRQQISWCFGGLVCNKLPGFLPLRWMKNSGGMPRFECWKKNGTEQDPPNGTKPLIYTWFCLQERRCEAQNWLVLEGNVMRIGSGNLSLRFMNPHSLWLRTNQYTVYILYLLVDNGFFGGFWIPTPGKGGNPTKRSSVAMVVELPSASFETVSFPYDLFGLRRVKLKAEQVPGWWWKGSFNPFKKGGYTIQNTWQGIFSLQNRGP